MRGAVAACTPGASPRHVPCTPRLTSRAAATGAKLFYLSGMRNGKYLQREVLNLARFIAVQKFRPLTWRQAHPFLLADRFEVRRSPPDTSSRRAKAPMLMPMKLTGVVRQALFFVRGGLVSLG